MNGYTGGEIRALIAPIFGQEPENLVHITLIAHTAEHETVFWDSMGSENAGCSPLQVAHNLGAVIMDILGAELGDLVPTSAILRRPA